MKSNKSVSSKSPSKSVAPIKMKSALTNLNHLVRAVPKAKTAAPKEKPVAKTRSVKPSAVETSHVAQPSFASIEVKIDGGFGNMLFIRGQGCGLSWDKGVQLTCRDQSTWLWSAKSGKDRVEFKLLLNDEVWALGENLTVAPGEKLDAVPIF